MSVGPERIFHITPNLSMTPVGALWFYASVVVGTLIVSGGVAMAGFWPVLPFAGLELALLGGVLYVIQRRGRYKEVLRVDDQQIVIEKGEIEVAERVEFARHWASVEMTGAPRPEVPSVLAISGHGKRCIVGQCLTEDERKSLARRLAQCIGPFDSSPELVGNGHNAAG
ncbi:MAG: DUF2244 domain-containing protein [Gammaproteobacteria bacterium]